MTERGAYPFLFWIVAPSAHHAPPATPAHRVFRNTILPDTDTARFWMRLAPRETPVHQALDSQKGCIR